MARALIQAGGHANVADHVSVGAWVEGDPHCSLHDLADEAQQGETGALGPWGWVEGQGWGTR